MEERHDLKRLEQANKENVGNTLIKPIDSNTHANNDALTQLKHIEEDNYVCGCNNTASYCKCNCFDIFLNELYYKTLKEFLDQYIYISLEEKYKLIHLFNIETGWKRLEGYNHQVNVENDKWAQIGSSLVRTNAWLKERGYI